MHSVVVPEILPPALVQHIDSEFLRLQPASKPTPVLSEDLQHSTHQVRYELFELRFPLHKIVMLEEAMRKNFVVKLPSCAEQPRCPAGYVDMDADYLE